MPIVRYTPRSLVEDVPRRWEKQYGVAPADPHKAEIGRKLAAIDTSIADAEDINRVIGNDTWTKLPCHNCGKWSGDGVRVGEEPDYESSTANVCRDCLREAYRMVFGESPDA
jgi:hypothetical protein